MAENRRSRLPPTLAGRVFRYDRKTTIIPLEISLRSPHWEEMPKAQRDSRNYHLQYLPSGVRGQTIFAHEHLESLLKGKREKP